MEKLKAVHVSAPGKLFIAGEYAILEKGHTGLVAAVDKRVHCRITPIEEPAFYISVKDFGIERARCVVDKGKLAFDSNVSREHLDKLKFLKEAAEIFLQYSGRKGQSHGLEIETWGEMSQVRLENGKTEKLGFGSSAAATVAIVAALEASSGKDVLTEEGKMRVFKLASLIHYFTQGKIGSSYDVAASTFGGVFEYSSPDQKKLSELVLNGRKVQDLVAMKWPDLKVSHVGIPEGLELGVCWTKQSASTTELVTKVNELKERNPEAYSVVLEKIKRANEGVIFAWKKGDREQLLRKMEENEQALHELGDLAGAAIETVEFVKMCNVARENGCAAKISGAGGGDSGIAACFSKEELELVRKGWQEQGLYPVDVKISPDGIRVEGK